MGGPAKTFQAVLYFGVGKAAPHSTDSRRGYIAVEQ